MARQPGGVAAPAVHFLYMHKKNIYFLEMQFTNTDPRPTKAPFNTEYFMKFLLVLILSAFSLNAMASSQSEDLFIKKVYALIETENIKMVDVAPESLNAKQTAGLMKAAREESDIWYDTILEGDYVLNSETDIEVAALTKYYSASGEFVAYHALIQHAAYDVASCDINWEDDQEAMDQFLKDNCTSGYISSGIFISPDFKFHFRDENSIEDFSEQ